MHSGGSYQIDLASGGQCGCSDERLACLRDQPVDAGRGDRCCNPAMGSTWIEMRADVTGSTPRLVKPVFSDKIPKSVDPKSYDTWTAKL